MEQASYLTAKGDTRHWCNRHHQYDCGCGGRPSIDYAVIEHAICRVLEIYASPDKPMPPRRIQRMIKHFGVDRPYIYRDLQRLEAQGFICRRSERTGFYLSSNPKLLITGQIAC